MGESTHLWQYDINNDIALLPFISSANIACGAHAGDEDNMRRLVEQALKYGVAIGAHASYADRENFGRIDLMDKTVRAQDLPGLLLTQIYRLQKVCDEFGTKLHHIKLHGALYNRAAWDESVSDVICKTILQTGNAIVLYGLSGSKMKTTAESAGLPFANEVFADRTYQNDGSLTPRTMPGAMITDEEHSLQQVLQMVMHGTVSTTSGSMIPVQADSICVHSDGANALAFAKNIHRTLQEKNIEIKSARSSGEQY